MCFSTTWYATAMGCHQTKCGLIYSMSKALSDWQVHIAEICIASPLAKAESERVFTFLWRLFSKKRTLVKNDTLNNLLQLRCDRDFSAQRYKHAIDLVETVYLDGTVRKAARYTEGHCYPTQRISRTVEVSSSEKQINALA